MGYGDELRDQLGDIDHYTQNSVVYLEDFRDYVKERVAIEREYTGKLDALVKTYARKVRKSGYSYFGAGTSFREDKDVPKGDSEVDLSKTTASQGMTAIFLQTEIAARARTNFADRLVSVVSEPLKAEYKRKNEARAKHIAFAEQLASALAASKAEVDKAKQAYRAACNQLEASYLRFEKAPTSEQSEKLKREWNEALVFKNDRQNEYLLAVQMLNAHKKNHIFVDMATLMNNMQDLNEHTITRAREIFTDYINLENQLLTDVRQCNDNAANVVSQMNGATDSQTFVAQVKKPWVEPPDEQFSPFTDKDTAVLDKSTGQTLLLNTLLKLRRQVEKHEAEIVAKLKEIDGTKTLIDSYAKGLNKGDVFPVQQELIELERQRAVIQTLKVKLSAQIEMIEGVVGYIETKDHAFKGTSSGMCVLCKSSLSIFNRGLQCQECKATVHTKCSTKIPPCGHQLVTVAVVANVAPSSGGNLVRSKTTRAPNRSSVRKSLHAPSNAFATVLYDFQKQNEGELEAKAGDKIRVIDPDDGNGWMTGELNGVTGVIPANYVEMPKDIGAAMAMASSPASSLSASTNSLPGQMSIQSFAAGAGGPPAAKNTGDFVRALYDYEAQVNLELSISAGDIIEVTNRNVGEGWWEGKLNGKVGQFPQNYVEPA